MTHTKLKATCMGMFMYTEVSCYNKESFSFYINHA